VFQSRILFFVFLCIGIIIKINMKLKLKTIVPNKIQENTNYFIIISN